MSPKTHSPHKSEHTELHENKLQQKPRNSMMRRYAVYATIAVAGLVGIASIIHATPLRFYLNTDPWTGSLAKVRSVFATTAVEKAHLELSLAEARLQDFQDANRNDATRRFTGTIASDMVEHNKAAMAYMDKAKQGGEDIKKLHLVKRLCDSLGDQSEAISSANAEIVVLHDYASKLEDRVAAGQDLEAAISDLNNANSAVQQGLNDAMHW